MKNLSLRHGNLWKDSLMIGILYGNMTLLSMVFKSLMLSSPFLWITPSLTYSYPSDPHHTELLSPVAGLSHLATLDACHPKPRRYYKKGKEKDTQAQGYYGNKERTQTSIWKHGLDSRDLVAWDGYDGPTGYFDEEYDSLYLYSAMMAQTETDLFHTKPWECWLIDSSATNHISPYLEDFTSLNDREKVCEITNGMTMKMTGLGHIIMKPGNRDAIILQNIWHSPHSPYHLLSLLALTKLGYTAKINQTATIIWNKHGWVVIQASALSPTRGLHWFQSSQITPMISSTMSLQETDSIQLWHYCFGHASTNVLCNTYKTCTGFPLDWLSTFTNINTFYKGCALGKHIMIPHTSLDSQATSVLLLVHTDLLEMPILSQHHNKWFITFLDNFSS